MKSSILKSSNLHAYHHSLRKQRGSGLVEGVLGFFLVVLGTVGGTLLIGNVGLTMYYQEKLTYITTQAATFASNHDAPSSASIKPFVDDLLKQVGLPASESVVVEPDAVKKTVKVTVNIVNLTLIGKGTILPAFLPRLSDTEVASTQMRPFRFVRVLRHYATVPWGMRYQAEQIGGEPCIPIYVRQGFDHSIDAMDIPDNNGS